MIYLDNAATTQPSAEVVDVMMPYFHAEYGNPGALYKLGKNANAAVAIAREHVADFIGSGAEDIVFTSGGSEANSLAIIGCSDYLRNTGKTHIIISRTEHDSVMNAAIYLRNNGFRVSFLPVGTDGVVSVGTLKSMIRNDTGLVSVMYVNNETGAVNPVQDIADVCAEHDILFHTDCVQAAGSEKISVDEIGCDFLSISSHKIHGPKGAGCLYVKNRDVLSPLIFGGKDQEHGLRGGTENIPAIVGFGEACRICKDSMHNDDIHVSVLKQRFYSAVKKELANLQLDGIMHLNSDIVKHGKILNLRFDGVDAETLILILNNNGVCISAGSACRSHESEPSHVLVAMGLSAEEARSSVRISFSKYNTEEEILIAARTLARCVNVLLGVTE